MSTSSNTRMQTMKTGSSWSNERTMNDILTQLNFYSSDDSVTIRRSPSGTNFQTDVNRIVRITGIHPDSPLPGSGLIPWYVGNLYGNPWEAPDDDSIIILPPPNIYPSFLMSFEIYYMAYTYSGIYPTKTSPVLDTDGNSQLKTMYFITDRLL